MSDGVIGSVAVAVVPDAGSFWVRFREQTQAGAGEAGRRAGEDWRRGFDEATRSASVRVRADTSEARAQVAALNRDINNDHGGGSPFAKLLSAAITLAPAIVPLGAAAAAAGAEFAALGATGILALKGIQAEIAAGTPVGVEYSGLIRTLKGDLKELGQTASGGVLSGFEQSVGKLQQQLPGLNTIVESQSAVLGDVASHLTGALVGGFTSFAPLLDQVGGSVDRIAAHFETWATGPGGAHFSQTLSTDYAKVAPLVDDIATGISHLVAASNGVGIGILSELGLLAKVVSDFPTPVLTALIAGFVSFRTIGAITGVVNGISGAFAGVGARAAASAAQVNAAALEVEAGLAAEAAAVATSQAAAAAAFAAAQAEIAASVAGEDGALTGLAAVAVAAAAEEAAAFQTAATEAQASAARIAAAAEEAAVASRAAGAQAGLGWSAMLGPIGIVIGAVGLLGLSMLGTSDSTEQNTRSVEDYTSALVASKGAINDAVRASVAKSLADDGAFDAATKLGIGQAELTTAVAEGGPAFDKLRAQVKAAAGEGNNLIPALNLVGVSSKETSNAALSLSRTLDLERQNFATATEAARDQEAALAGVGTAVDYTKQQISDGDTALRGYIDALKTFNSSADTAADRASLIGSVLVASNGDLLAYATTASKSAKAVQQLGDDVALAAGKMDKPKATTKDYLDSVINLKTGTIDYHNAAAVPLIADLGRMQDAAEKVAAATYQHELRTKGAKRAADDAFKVYESATRGQLIDQATKLGLSAGQAKKLADQYFGIKNAGDIKKKIELIGEDKVVAALKGILVDLDILIGKTTVLDVQIANANAHAAKNIGRPGDVLVKAAGGYISGPGSATSDSIPARLSNGEFVINAAQTARNRHLLESINNGAKGFAAGGFAGLGERVQGGGGDITIEQHITRPADEPTYVSLPAVMRDAAFALDRR